MASTSTLTRLKPFFFFHQTLTLTRPFSSQTLTLTSDLHLSDPIPILSSLWTTTFSRRSPSPIPNLSGFLHNPHLWILSFQLASTHLFNSLPSNTTIPLSPLLSLRQSVLSGDVSKSDHFDPRLRERIVQELLLMVLEPVFERRFSGRSHGWRPGRSCHTALRTVRSGFAGFLWYVRIDFKAVSDGFTPELVMRFVREGVADRKVLRLVKSVLRGRVEAKEEVNGKSRLAEKRLKRKVIRAARKKKVLKEGEPKPDPYWLRVFYSFAPEEAEKVPEYGHCGILSPLLANVCFDELDKWVEGRIEEYFCPSKDDSIWKESITDGCHNPSWPEFVPTSGRDKTRKMDYIRYGLHALIGIRGPREDAVKMRSDLIEFVESKYGIKLENSKVEIEHVTRGIQFLDHVISRRVIYPTLHYTATGGKIISKKGVGTLLSVTANLQRCVSQFRKLDLVKGDKDPEPLPCVAMFYSGQAHTNVQMNKFLETMAEWYRYADNRKKVVGFCAYVIRSSLAKLYAARYRLKSRAKVYKIASRDLSKPLVESTRNDIPQYSDLLRMGLVDAIDGVQFSHMSLIPSCDYTPFPRNWIPDHERVLHDYIRLQDPKLFCELYKSVKRQDLNIPQDEMSKIVWHFKVHGVHRGKSQESTRDPNFENDNDG